MSTFIVEGGHRLSGAITPQGAKNEALEVICATLLTDERVTLRNVPDILDVRNLIRLLEQMGVAVTREDAHTYTFCAANIDIDYIFTPEFTAKAQSLRGSVMIIGPLVARFGRAMLPKPGGDKIGRRRLDTHFLGMEKLGAKFRYIFDRRSYDISAENGLRGAYMLLDEASVTGTANLVMAAVLAEGETIIYNAACEPYVQQLCRMLVSMGARIEGIASNLLRINGVERLHGTVHTMQPDMIEVGSFVGIAAMTGSGLTLKDVNLNELGIMPDNFRRMGIEMIQQGNDILIPERDGYQIETFIDGSIMTFADAPWPGLSLTCFPSSSWWLLRPQAPCSSIRRCLRAAFFFVDKLIDMGARIILCDPHRAAVIGSGKLGSLHATNMVSPDIRAGIAMLIAALGAKGTSRIQNIDQIDRGYEQIDLRLNALGAHILREE